MIKIWLQRIVVAVFLACTLTAYAEVPVVVVGDMNGYVYVQRLDGAGLNISDQPISHAVAHIETLDADGDGEIEVVVTYLDAVNLPSLCLNTRTLSIEWATDQYTSYFAYNIPDEAGAKNWSGDFDGDGDLELVIPNGLADDSNGPEICVFSGTDGHAECCLPRTHNYYPIGYLDPVDDAWRIVCQNSPSSFTHYMRVYDADDCGAYCENTGVNMWKRGAVGTSMIDGEPRIWGGWYGRTLYVADRNCNTLWSRSYGGSLEAAGTYAGDLCGDGVETLLVAGTYGTNHIRIDAARLDNGNVIWTYDDDNAHWSAHVVAVGDVNGDQSKEVFLQTHFNQSAGIPPKYVALDGCDGHLIWERTYPYDTSMLVNARLYDVDGDGVKEVLLVVNNTIEARNGLTGELVETFEFFGAVTSFQLTRMTLDCNNNGVSDDEDILAGYSIDCNSNGIPDECDLDGDIDGDGDVDLSDLASLLANYGRQVYNFSL